MDALHSFSIKNTFYCTTQLLQISTLKTAKFQFLKDGVTFRKDTSKQMRDVGNPFCQIKATVNNRIILIHQNMCYF